MTPEQEAILDARYPALLDGVRGYECGPGWFKLIDEMCAKLAFVASKSGAAIRVSCIKEKLGSGRFYWSLDDANVPDEPLWYEIVKDIVFCAECESAHVCEETGEYGVRCTKGGWLKTLSREKAKEMGFTPVEER